MRKQKLKFYKDIKVMEPTGISKQIVEDYINTKKKGKGSYSQSEKIKSELFKDQFLNLKTFYSDQ